ncbi:hypothetical protein [Calidifontibacter terrae]
MSTAVNSTPFEVEEKTPAEPASRWIPGPSPFTVAAGLIFLMTAILAAIVDTQNWEPDWSIVGPSAIVAIGLLLAAAGVMSAFKRSKD